MSSCPAIAHVNCFRIEGADARRFAQAQFSGDVEALAPGHWQWNAWLDARGRVRALMHLADPGDGTLVAVLRGGDAEAVRTALARYLFRMRATVVVRRYAACAGGPAGSGTAHIAEHAIVLGYGARSVRLETDERPPDPAAQAMWRLAEIRQGWPRLPPGESEFLPPALGLERLGAVAFDKGCYPGQEIVARLHYRGGHKYRLYHLHAAASLSSPQPGNAAFRVLDSVAGGESTDALAIGPIDLSDEVDLAGATWRVVSRFGA